MKVALGLMKVTFLKLYLGIERINPAQLPQGKKGEQALQGGFSWS